jgi:phospholipid/cholesterol/gamma-HCH transport system substrate-binding protein
MSRFAKEGAAGLMIIGGVVLFAGLVAWIKGIGLGQKSYRVTVNFSDAKGMPEGTPLRYRGVEIGKAVKISPTTESVKVEVEVTATDLRIPGDSIVQVDSSALLGDKSMDILVQGKLPKDATLPLPTDPACNPKVMICDGSVIQGQELPDLGDLIQTTYQATQLFSDPLLMTTVRHLGESVISGSSGISGLGKNVNTLTTSLNGQVGNLEKALTSVGGAADQLNSTAGEIKATAVTARQILETNRTVIALTLGNFGTASDDLITLMNNLNPVVRQVHDGKLMNNLEVLSDNLRRSSAKLLVATNAMTDPSNVQMLQQTLDSARMTFQNAQKITTDLEELSGDTRLRDDVRRLLGGLGGLFGRAKQLEQQVSSTQSVIESSTGKPWTVKGLGTTDWDSWHKTTANLNTRLSTLETKPTETSNPTPSPSPSPSPEATSTP